MSVCVLHRFSFLQAGDSSRWPLLSVVTCSRLILVIQIQTESYSYRLCHTDTDNHSCVQVVTLDMGLLVAGTKYRGEFEERLKKLMEEIKQNDDIILVSVSSTIVHV